MTTSDSAVPFEEKLAAAVRAERLAKAHGLVKNYVLAAAGIGLVPLPLADLAGLIALQVKLAHGLAKHYDVPFQRSAVRSLVASLLSGTSSTFLAKGFASLAKAVPVLGGLAGGGGVAAAAASLTYAVGEVFIQHFERGGTLLDFDLDKAKALFRRELKTGHAAASAEAVAEATQNGGPAGEDRLEDIVGIGEVYADRLRAAGVVRFADLAALPPKRVKEIIGRGFPLSKENIQSWIKQADGLAHGRHPETFDD